MIILLKQLRQVQRVISSKARKKMTNFLILKMNQIGKTVVKLIFLLLKNHLIKKSSLVKRRLKVPYKIPVRSVDKLVL